MLPPSGSILILEGPGGLLLPRFSARFMTQSWAPIPQSADLRYDVNGELVNLSAAQFRKYKTEISCSGKIGAQAFSNLFPGDPVTVHCIFEWGFLDSAGEPIRPVVEGSLRVTDEGFTFYRPILDCLVASGSPSGDFAEWEADKSWKLELWER